jgi:hypothetical protein
MSTRARRPSPGSAGTQDLGPFPLGRTTSGAGETGAGRRLRALIRLIPAVRADSGSGVRDAQNRSCWRRIRLVGRNSKTSGHDRLAK